MMKKNEKKYPELEAVLEVRGWKMKVSEEIRQLGAEEYHRRSAERHKDLFAKLDEKKRRS